MSGESTDQVTTIGIDIGKNSFHLIGLDSKGAIVLRQKLSRGQVRERLANLPRCLIGMEACVGAHYLCRQALEFGHDARLMPARYVKPFLKGQKIAEAGRKSEEVIVADINLYLIRMLRDSFLFFRDRRPEMYGPLLRMTG